MTGLEIVCLIVKLLKMRTMKPLLNFSKRWTSQGNNPTYQAGNEDVQSGIDFAFKFETIGGGFIFRNLLIKSDDTVHISKEY
nr:hypothetical protein [Anaerotignum sp.]